MYIMKETGRAIGKYQPLWGSWRVGELIGQGNGFEMYRVYKEEWGKQYISTVKLLSCTIGKDDIKEALAIGIEQDAMPEYFKSLVGNIRNEIELMYRLRGNSNIVTYEDHEIFEKRGCLGWDILIRMESLQPLPDFLLDRELERLDVVKLGIDICKALEACCREGIIHRDIRDSSIFVSPRGEFKLGSFSMAKEHPEGGRLIHAQFNPLYMAPELYKDQSYDFSVDLYSLGIVMYKLLNKGRLPFLPLPPDNITAADTERSLARRMSGAELPLPVEAGDNLGAVIIKACSYDKKDRYKSPREFRQRLERLLKADTKTSKGVGTRTDSMLYYPSAEVLHTEKQTTAEQEEADAQAAYAEELERLAVVELASSVEKMDNARKLSKRRFIRNAGIWTAIMVSAFAIAFVCSYEVDPDIVEPVSKAPIVTSQPSPSPTITAAPTMEPAVTKPKEIKNQNQASKKQTEEQKLYNNAVEHYEKHEYEKAIAVFEELAKADAKYSVSEQYADSFFRLAEEYNALGMKYYIEGKLEKSAETFDAAIGMLERMKNDMCKYDTEVYEKRYNIYSGNKNSVLEKNQKINKFFKLADECNREGVKLYEEGSFDKAGQEFENALELLREIRLLVPNYSANGYDGIMKIYEGNLRRIEEKQ